MYEFGSAAPIAIAVVTVLGGIAAVIKTRDVILTERVKTQVDVSALGQRVTALEGHHREVLAALESKADKKDVTTLHTDLKSDIRELRGILLGKVRE
jgi:hypothetical protein